MPNSSDLLLDTHVLVWLLEDSERLGPTARRLITGGGSVRYSAASVWELVLKQRRGRFVIGPGLVEGIQMAGVQELPVTAVHSLHAASVELPHNDPFDALIIAQAQAESLTLVTADRLVLSSGACALVDARR
ncbi:type II toxin-antitoxin system VapC family toxin [Luteococcus sanguinis]|uniref:Type II toxin-antitoxin system VapC family toxin n=1 Tax=Luteococcus sanguinis TaxID=174038 RepID=A0ABW1X1A9_9ACTN